MLDETTTKGLEADIVTYNSLINAYSQRGDVKALTRLFDKMTTKGLKANIATYNTLVNACWKRGDVEEAARWFDEMTTRVWRRTSLPTIR